MKQLLVGICMIACFNVAGQNSYPCIVEGGDRLRSMLGTWQVEAKDRVSPGKYESNKGISTISTGIQGCSITESYRGMFKENSYAIETTLLLVDSMKLQRVYFDSEHANVMLFDGVINESRIELIWLKNPERKKMQVKFELTFKSEDTFEWKTHLTTDYGQTWQLTHHWKYRRALPFDATSSEHQLIKSSIDGYHKGLTDGKTELVKNALASNFIMYNGNYSGNAINWQAHMYLTGDDLNRWPELFVKEAGPYSNSYQILSIYTRGNAAVVVTRDTGKNKFRQWNNEQTTWLLGKSDGQWKIVGYYLRDISNP